MNKIQRSIYYSAGVLARFFSKRTYNPTHDFWYTPYLPATSSGINVTEETSASLSAVYACVKKISETIGSTPLILYERNDDESRTKRRDHHLFKILRKQANPRMTAKQWLQTVSVHMCFWGNHFSWIEFNEDREIEALWPLHPRKVVPILEDKNIRYKFIPDSGDPIFFEREEMFHPRLFSWDGVNGLSPIRQARESIGLGMAAQEYGARLFSNDASPGGVFTHPGTIDEEVYDDIKGQLIEKFAGLANRHKPMILEDGVKFEPVSMHAEDAQFVQSRKFQVTEIARFFGMPPHMIQDLEKASFNNIEEQSLEYAKYTILPWFVEIEQEIQIKLADMIAVGNEDLFPEFLMSNLLRGDTNTRYKSYSTGRQWGWLSANDVRKMENMNPIGEQGDMYMVPLNMIPADLAGAVITGASNQQDHLRKIITIDPLSDSDEASSHIVKMIAERSADQNGNYNTRSVNVRKNIIKDNYDTIKKAATEIVDIEIKAIKDRISQDKDWNRVVDWINDFYREFPKEIVGIMMPPINDLAEQIMLAAADEVGSDAMSRQSFDEFMQRYIDGFSVRHSISSGNQIKNTIRDNKDDELEKLIDDRLDNWKDKKPDRIANNETVRSASAIARKMWIVAGITRIIWIASSPCEICAPLSGKVVGIDKPFGLPGDTIGPLSNRRIFYHPPAHRACQCSVGPI